MKLKYYLRGIGIGMIVTTIVLMITFAIHSRQPLTDDEIRERATELGMIMPEDLPDRDTLASADMSEQGDVGTDPQSPSDEAGDADASDGMTDADADADADGKSDTDAQDKDKDKNEDQTQPEVVEQVEVTIVGGEYSNAVCQKLEKAGVIEDADDFNKYMSENGFDNLIQPGNYTIPKDADYDEIIKMITEKKR